MQNLCSFHLKLANEALATCTCKIKQSLTYRMENIRRED